MNVTRYIGQRFIYGLYVMYGWMLRQVDEFLLHYKKVLFV